MFYLERDLMDFEDWDERTIASGEWRLLTTDVLLDLITTRKVFRQLFTVPENIQVYTCQYG